MTLIIIIIV